MAYARTLRRVSDHVAALQRAHLKSFLAVNGEGLSAAAGGGHAPLGNKQGTGQEEHRPRRGYRVALCVPMTPKGTDMAAVDQSFLWFNLFASFMESVRALQRPPPSLLGRRLRRSLSAVRPSPRRTAASRRCVVQIDWETNAHEFTFYLGLDRGDPLFDT